MELLIFVYKFVDSVLFSKLDSEVDKSLLFLDEFLVLDPVVPRVDLSNQVQPLLPLFLSDSSVGHFGAQEGELVLVGGVPLFALVFIGGKGDGFAFKGGLLCDLGYFLGDSF